MKRLVCIVLVLVMAAALLASCSDGKKTAETDSTPSETIQKKDKADISDSEFINLAMKYIKSDEGQNEMIRKVKSKEGDCSMISYADIETPSLVNRIGDEEDKDVYSRVSGHIIAYGSFGVKKYLFHWDVILNVNGGISTNQLLGNGIQLQESAG